VITRRRFHFVVRINGGLPPTFVDRFSTPGRHSFEAAFARRARRHRLSTRIVLSLLIGFGLGLSAAAMLPVSEVARLWIVGLSAALLPIAVLVHVVNLRLRCPSCRRPLAPAKGRYCPQCGSGAYLAGSGQCDDCGARIEEETGEDARSYRIRGCTHCGVFLDERGL